MSSRDVIRALGMIRLGDSVVVTARDGDATNTILDDTSQNITYSSEFNGCHNDFNSQLYQGTNHCASVLGSTASISFFGNGISVYGVNSQDQGTYSVGLDGSAATVYNGSSFALNTQAVLYSSSGLSSGHHTLLMTTTEPTSANKYLIIDKAVVSSSTVPISSTPISSAQSSISLQVSGSLPGSASVSSGPAPTSRLTTSGSNTETDPSATSTTTQSATAGTPAAHSAASNAAVIGGATAGGIVVVLLGVLFFVLWRRRASRRNPDTVSQKQLEARPLSPPRVAPVVPAMPVTARPYVNEDHRRAYSKVERERVRRTYYTDSSLASPNGDASPPSYAE